MLLFDERECGVEQNRVLAEARSSSEPGAQRAASRALALRI
jgi:hypothetical protein